MEQIYRIGIDHGYGNIKTAHHIFESGVIERVKESELAGMTVEYEGKFFEIGSTHKEYQMDKVWDEDYYILTLAALAKELKGRGLCNASVILAVGLPIKWLGEQGEGFRKYLLRNKEVTFRCNDTRYHVKIEDVEVYAQGFAAVAADLPSYQGFNIVADIGNGTMNVIFIIDGKPDSSRYYAIDPDRRRAADSLMEKLRPLSDDECMETVHDIRKNYRLPKGGRTVGELIAEARQRSGAEQLKGHDFMALERFDPEVRHMVIFEVLSGDSFVGDKGDRMRLFLTDAGYRKFQDRQEKGEIKIEDHRKVTPDGHLRHEHSGDRERIR